MLEGLDEQHEVDTAPRRPRSAASDAAKVSAAIAVGIVHQRDGGDGEVDAQHAGAVQRLGEGAVAAGEIEGVRVHGRDADCLGDAALEIGVVGEVAPGRVLVASPRLE